MKQQKEITLTAAQLYVLISTDKGVHEECSNSMEPFRCLMDISRERKLHDITDGSEEYQAVFDAFEAIDTHGY